MNKPARNDEPIPPSRLGEVELHLRERRTLAANDAEPGTPRTPEEAAARILELREGNFLPEGETIRDLIDYGRA